MYMPRSCTTTAYPLTNLLYAECDAHPIIVYRVTVNDTRDISQTHCHSDAGCSGRLVPRARSLYGARGAPLTAFNHKNVQSSSRHPRQVPCLLCNIVVARARRPGGFVGGARLRAWLWAVSFGGSLFDGCGRYRAWWPVHTATVKFELLGPCNTLLPLHVIALEPSMYHFAQHVYLSLLRENVHRRTQ
ncbi:hypothetical protein VTO73DRAFT_12040 [Trametes versicolor]